MAKANAMGIAISWHGLFAIILCLLVALISTSTSIVHADELSLVVSQSTTLQISPGLVVENSPGSKPGTKVICERVQIHGLSRLTNLRKFSHSVKVNISYLNPSGRPPNAEVCFHRNQSLAIGMCPPGQWMKLTKGSWVRSMSPFDHKFLDIRMASSSKENFQVSLHEDFFWYRVMFLVLGILLSTLASFLSKSLVFYYGGAMSVGVFLVILMVLFQGMKLLPTGRKSSLAIFLYSSIIGVGSFILRYVPQLLRSILDEIGIGEDMYTPLAIFLLLFLAIAGAWLGFWVVHKLVLAEDGSIDIGVSHFVGWSIRIFAYALILQSSVDPLLALLALICGILISSILRRLFRPKFVLRFFKNLSQIDMSYLWESQDSYTSPLKGPYDSRPFKRNLKDTISQGSPLKPRSLLSETDAFYSTFHNTPERKKISKDEWDKLTKDTTKKAMEELVSSPDFSKWAVAHADRITLAPKRDTTGRQRRWYQWL
ncbi:hypothetical protein K7X08_017434 [Anisodus acutangulus]|uniref:Nuclear envelope integral membrane protein 1 n=1 Tax=Anisodus acutangulus TaxID=402998 RepID=A0A9Q1LTS0_9SOLA|nr:hypothetical protein K7X08_017434 [Anisodus acutangulus]